MSKYFVVYKKLSNNTDFEAKVCTDLDSVNRESTWLVNCGHPVNSIYVFKTTDALIRNWSIKFKEVKLAMCHQ